MPGPHGAPDGGYAKPKNAKKTVNKMLEYIGKSKYLLFLVSFTVIASTACSVLASARLQPIIDKAIYPHFNQSELIKQLIILAVFYITASVLSFAQSKIMVNIAYKTSNKM